MTDLRVEPVMPSEPNPQPTPAYKSTAPSWLFGFIAAYFQVRNAKSLGLTDTRRYWKAAAISTVGGIIVSIVFAVLMLTVVIASLGNATRTTSIGNADNGASVSNGSGSIVEGQSPQSVAISEAKALGDPDLIASVPLTPGSMANKFQRSGNYAESSLSDNQKENDSGIAVSVLYQINSDRTKAFCTIDHLPDPGYLAYVYDSTDRNGYVQDIQKISNELSSHYINCSEKYSASNVIALYKSDTVLVAEYDNFTNSTPDGHLLSTFIKRGNGIWYDHKDTRLS